MSTNYAMRGGLFVPEHSMDERAVQQALKLIDDRLILWPPDAESGYYRVVASVSDWQPVIHVCAWMDDHGNPLPLSSGLVDKVNRLRPDAPNKDVPVEEFNDRLRERREQEAADAGRAVIEEHQAYVERGRVTVSLGAGTSKRYWQRNKTRPR